MYYYAVINTVYTRARIGSKRNRVCVVYRQSTVPHMDAVLSGCAIVHVKTPFIYSSILSSIIFSHSHLLSHSSYVIYTAKRVCARKCCSSCTGHTRSTVPCHAMPYMPTHSPRTTAEMPWVAFLRQNRTALDALYVRCTISDNEI